ncbi:MAG: hypothetical protein GX755_05025 [Syntrophomonadaceae bacterium]|nr:hypothetical protein [Syntrophomonadaceae bacterium]
MVKNNRLWLMVGVVFFGAFFLFVQSWFDSKKSINQLLGFVSSDTISSVVTNENKTEESVQKIYLNQTEPTVLKANQLNRLITLEATSKVALIRLEDVGPGGKYATLEDLGRLRAIVDYLYAEGIPFQDVAVISYNPRLPRYCSQISQTVWLKLPEDFREFVPLAGDFNGDAQDDLVFYSRHEGSWWTALSKGDKYSSPELWLMDWGRGEGWTPHIGDFNGDGKSDLLLYSPKYQTCQIALAEQKNFKPQSDLYREIISNSSLAIGDANGDNKDDLYFFNPARGKAQVALSQGQTFTEPRTWLEGWITGDELLVGDVNGDSQTDIILRSQDNGTYFIAVSADDRFIPQTRIYGPWAAGTHRRVMLADFDGNGKDDLASWYQSAVSGKVLVDISYSFQS